MATTTQKRQMPKQKQHRQPGSQKQMTPGPSSISERYKPSGKLSGKVALITGGDSGIGRSTAFAFALEGADIAVVYLNEHQDARDSKAWIEEHGRRCLLISGDVGDEQFCRRAVEETVRHFGHLDVLVNNAAEQHPQESIEKISAEQLERTFRTNIFAYFFMAKAAIEHLKEGGSIINTTSITAFRGSEHLLDYSSTKGAIVTFTRSLAKALADRKIRVNAVAPGPVWTPLIPATFPPERVESFGQKTPMGRPAQPEELAPSYVFLASKDASYMTGQVLHLNGGEFVTS